MKKKRNPFIRFMGMGTQMLAPILAGIYIGKFLDGKFNPGGKGWSIGLTLFGVFAGIALVIKEVMKLGNDQGSS